MEFGEKLKIGWRSLATVVTAISLPIGLLANLAQLDWSKTTFATVGLLVGAITTSLIAAVIWRRTRGAGAQDAAARRIVQLLHERWFPESNALTSNQNGAAPPRLDPDYRVSLWTVGPNGAKPTEWNCQHRTHGMPRGTWEYVTDREKLRFAGVIMNAAAAGTGIDVPGVPEAKRNDAGACQAYWASACTTQQANESRSWPYATIKARVARTEMGNVAAVLMIERRSGLPIEAVQPYTVMPKEESSSAVELCVWELELVAELWARAREH